MMIYVWIVWMMTIIIISIIIDPIGCVDAARHLNERDDVTGQYPSSAEELLAKRQHQKEQYEMKLEEFQQQLSAHQEGLFVLQDFEVERLHKKIKSYSQKIQHLSKDLHDRVSFFF